MILVTGANGFVGNAVVSRLSHSRRDVLAGIRTVDSVRPDGVRCLALGDLASEMPLPAMPGVECVVHTAARVHVMADTNPDPLAAHRRVNVDGTLRLARHAQDAGARRFVFVSTAKVNGEFTGPGVAFRADDFPAPQDPYAASKWEAERALLALSALGRFEVVIVRPPLVYGPGVRANFLALMRLLRRGWPLPFAAIDNRRSFIALANLADLLVTCIDSPAAANGTYMASDGEDLSTPELLRRLAGALNVRPRLWRVQPRLLMAGSALLGAGVSMRRLCESLQIDSSATRQSLGWTPPLSVDEGLALTARHFLRETSF